MSKCHTTQEMLADYRTGILSDRRSAKVDAHLAECRDCERELRVLDDVLALVEANVPLQEPPAGLWNGIANRIASPETRRPMLSRWLTRPLRLAGASAAALALILGLMFGAFQQDSVVPTGLAAGNEYVQGHAMYAGQAPLADRVSYLSLVASSSTGSE